MCLLSGLFILVMLENPCSVCAVLFGFTLCIYYLLLTPAWSLLVEAVWWDLICDSMVTLACDVLTWLHTLPSKDKTFFLSVYVYMCACMDVVVTLRLVVWKCLILLKARLSPITVWGFVAFLSTSRHMPECCLGQAMTTLFKIISSCILHQSSSPQCFFTWRYWQCCKVNHKRKCTNKS